MSVQQNPMNLALRNARQADAMRLLIGHEAAVQKLAFGQTLTGLVMEAADVGSYQPEIRRMQAKTHGRLVQRDFEGAGVCPVG